MEYGTKWDWKDPLHNNDKLKWLQQKPYLPYACGLCFFFKNDKTIGIQSQPAVGVLVRKKSKLCSSVRENLGRLSGGYCRSGRGGDRSYFQEKCKTSRLGCPKYGVPMYVLCWEDYKHTPRFK